MIERNITPRLRQRARQSPVVAILGPRQSGKTTLARQVFPDHPYVSLERPDQREEALRDPRGFLERYPDGAIIDEVQRAGDLLSYLQGMVDEDPRPGRFILTGSHNLLLSRQVSQSLAGRVALVKLWPLSLDEIARFPHPPANLFETLFKGGFPRLHDQGLDPVDWLNDYAETYVERDLRELRAVGDLLSFRRFLRLCAAHTAQEQNLDRLGGDAGLSAGTVRAWLSVLEASYIGHSLPAWHANTRKRLVKAPKWHFIDTGLCCRLLGLRSPADLAMHPLRGPLFESWVVSEVAKARLNQGLSGGMYHLRTVRGPELNLLIEDGLGRIGVEMKSGATFQSEWLEGLRDLAPDLHPSAGGATPLPKGSRLMPPRLRLVYGGKESWEGREEIEVTSWSSLPGLSWDAGAP